MKVANQEQVAEDFAGYVKASRKGPVVVAEKGKPVAVLHNAENEDDLERLLMGHSAKLRAILQAARQRFAEGRGISHEDFWKDIAAEVAARGPKRSRPATENRPKR